MSNKLASFILVVIYLLAMLVICLYVQNNGFKVEHENEGISKYNPTIGVNIQLL